MADSQKWWQVYGTSPTQKEKANALYDAAAYMPRGSADGEAVRAADSLEQRGIIFNRVAARNKKKDASGVRRHTNMTLLDGIK